MSQTMLDLEKYFERDIIEFLDKQIELQESQIKGQSSEMIESLESNNISLATKILEDAITNYNKIPIDDVYKEIQLKKLLEMHRQATDFLTLHPQQSKFKDLVDLLKKSGQLDQGPIEKITVLEQKMNEQEEAKIEAREQEKRFALKLDEEIKEINNNIAKSIRKKDLKSAVKDYKQLRIYFEQYPSTNIDQKQEVYNDLLSFFMQINKLKKELDEEKVNSASDRAKLELATKSNTDKYLRLEDIKKIVSEIKEDVKNADFGSATQKTIELRQITSKIPDQYKYIRSILNAKIDVISQRVEFVKRIRSHN
jgi:hypothetical protein